MSLNSVTMSDNETLEPEDVGNHENFLVYMSGSTLYFSCTNFEKVSGIIRTLKEIDIVD